MGVQAFRGWWFRAAREITKTWLNSHTPDSHEESVRKACKIQRIQRIQRFAQKPLCTIVDRRLFSLSTTHTL